jgi:hypothetical protein
MSFHSPSRHQAKQFQTAAGLDTNHTALRHRTLVGRLNAREAPTWLQTLAIVSDM